MNKLRKPICILLKEALISDNFFGIYYTKDYGGIEPQT
jgi:hypothetical protein